MERDQAAVFLDRDGTINEEVGYLDRLEKLRLIPGSAGAIRRLNAAGFKTVVVTNQAGIARGFFDEPFLTTLHARLDELLRAEGAFLDGFYICPHHATEGQGAYLRACDCRKPAPGLLLRAVKELRLDPRRSFMVGDTLKDVEAGVRAGVRTILVRTGHGEAELEKLTDRDAPADSPQPGGVETGSTTGEIAPPGDPRRPHHVAADLAGAVRWILEQAP